MPDTITYVVNTADIYSFMTEDDYNWQADELEFYAETYVRVDIDSNVDPDDDNFIELIRAELTEQMIPFCD